MLLCCVLSDVLWVPACFGFGFGFTWLLWFGGTWCLRCGYPVGVELLVRIVFRFALTDWVLVNLLFRGL